MCYDGDGRLDRMEMGTGMRVDEASDGICNGGSGGWGGMFWLGRGYRYGDGYGMDRGMGMGMGMGRGKMGICDVILGDILGFIFEGQAGGKG